jgi:hypothetical protein
MKTRNGLILLSLMVLIAMPGCQRSVATGDDAAVGTEGVSSAAEPAQRMVRVRNPETGRIETRPVPAKVDLSKETAVEEAVPAASSARYTTQRIRDPKTGRIETRQVPVETTAKTDNPCEKEAAAPPKPDKPDVATKPKPPKPDEFAVRWEEDCPVQKAFEASAWVLEDLGLAQDLTSYTTQRVRDPRTGRIQVRQVTSGNRSARRDGLSAYLEGHATADIKFAISILLTPPESSVMTITATSATQPEAVLEQQSLHLKEKISEAIAAEPEEPEAVPYPETMLLERPVQPAVDAIYRWAEGQGFEHDSRGGRDQYYRMVTCETGSGIRFEFTLRLVEPERTRLDIEASNYEGKDEFGMIVRGLMETLESINAQPPQAATEQKPYPEMLMLNHTVNHVAGVLGAWIQNRGFDADQMRGDAFYRTISCKTGSGIPLRFYLKLVDTETTKLSIYISGYERKEEFPMILKSLQETLAQMDEAAAVETGTDG